MKLILSEATSNKSIGYQNSTRILQTKDKKDLIKFTTIWLPQTSESLIQQKSSFIAGSSITTKYFKKYYDVLYAFFQQLNLENILKLETQILDFSKKVTEFILDIEKNKEQEPDLDTIFKVIDLIKNYLQTKYQMDLNKPKTNGFIIIAELYDMVNYKNKLYIRKLSILDDFSKINYLENLITKECEKSKCNDREKLYNKFLKCLEHV